jgi:two-component system cell cycle response regulator
MADPQRVPAEQVSRVRHDLRTFANHILGYSDMLLEVAREDDLATIIPGLVTIHEAGSTLLERIGVLLPSGRSDVTTADLVLLPDAFHELIETLLKHAKQLCDDTQALELEQENADAHKILTAVENLRHFVEDGVVPLAAGGAAELSAKPQAADEKARAAPRSTSHRGTILIVDDIANNRDMLARRLEREGYGVIEAANGREALERIARGGLDLVLLDILMPEVDGFEVLRQVKATPSGRDLPVIMISSLDEISSVVRCIEMGAEDYLPKPFDPVLLRARVGACMEKKQLRDHELDYLRQVAAVTSAATALESGKFDPVSLDEVARRDDPLGGLARVFQKMGREVQAREERLKMQVAQLKVEIDESRKKQQVAEVTETEYFQQLKRRAGELRRRAGRSDAPSS